MMLSNIRKITSLFRLANLDALAAQTSEPEALAPGALRAPKLRPRQTSQGMSLLEVILALAILGVSLGVIGELIRLGTRAGEKARNDTEAQLIAESLINEIAAGAQMPEMVTDAPIDEFDEWRYSVESQAIDEGGLLAVRVSVRRTDEIVNPNNPIRPYMLTRWIVDPGVEQAAREAEELMKAEAKARKTAAASGTIDGSAAQGTASGSDPSDTSNGQAGAGGANSATSPMPGSGRNQLPPGFDPSRLPAGFDPSQLPQGFDPSQLPSGFDPRQFVPDGGGRGGRGGGGGRGTRGGGP